MTARLDDAEVHASVSIGELAERTGVRASTLRSWEERVGFPVPVRSAGGQRRYRTEDVDRVVRILAERKRGLSLAAAVEAVRRAPRVGESSLFAQLRERHPHLDVLAVSFKVMRSLTWAIEDECLAHASRPLVFGSFQDQRSFDNSSRRWLELARSSSAAIAFADFAETRADDSPALVALSPRSPMLNEWSLICHDTQLAVALVAWERPRSAGTVERRFEAVLTLEPDVVLDAARLSAAAAAQNGMPSAPELVAEHVASAGEDPRRTASLLRRFVTYADA